jgi:hypothetical protein
MSPAFRVSGADGIVRNLLDLTPSVNRRVEAITKSYAFRIQKDAKIMCPVDTGRCRASISVNWTGSGMENGEVKGDVRPSKRSGKFKPLMPEDGVGNPSDIPGFNAVVGTNVEYAQDLEDTSPYLWPAFAIHRNTYKEAVENAVRDGLGDVKK